MAARLEAATKQFGVPLLISGALRNIMSERCRREMRHIDRVTVKGSIEPIDLYTCDTAPNKVSVARVSENSKMSDIQKKIIKHETNIRRSQRYNDACSDKISISSFFDQDPDIKAMRSPFTREFQDLFEKGIDLYLAGDWGKARQILEQTLVVPGFPSQLIPCFCSFFVGDASGIPRWTIQHHFGIHERREVHFTEGLEQLQGAS